MTRSGQAWIAALGYLVSAGALAFQPSLTTPDAIACGLLGATGGALFILAGMIRATEEQ